MAKFALFIIDVLLGSIWYLGSKIGGPYWGLWLSVLWLDTTFRVLYSLSSSFLFPVYILIPYCPSFILLSAVFWCGAFCPSFYILYGLGLLLFVACFDFVANLISLFVFHCPRAYNNIWNCSMVTNYILLVYFPFKEFYFYFWYLLLFRQCTRTLAALLQSLSRLSFFQIFMYMLLCLRCLGRKK